MNRQPEPCGKCARFLPDAQLRKGEEGPGLCEGFDRPAHSTDRSSVLFLERGSREARVLAKNDQQLLAEFQRRGGSKFSASAERNACIAGTEVETISRASAPTAVPT